MCGEKIVKEFRIQRFDIDEFIRRFDKFCSGDRKTMFVLKKSGNTGTNVG